MCMCLCVCVFREIIAKRGYSVDAARDEGKYVENEDSDDCVTAVCRSRSDGSSDK